MPVRRYRRCGRRMASCMALRRPCINSLPRYCMPRHPWLQSHHTQPSSNSSQSDCSCPEENFCTVENCRNAPMCIHTRPLYCPYGSYQRDGDNLPTSGRHQHSIDAEAASYPRGPLSDRFASPSPFYTQNNLSPLFPPDYGRTDREHTNGWFYQRPVPLGTSFRESSHHNFQRSSHIRLNNTIPQFISSSPGSQNAGHFEPQISTLHRTQQSDLLPVLTRADNSLLPSNHLTTTESITSENEVFNRLNYDIPHDQRDDGRQLLKDAFYRRIQCMKHGGMCGGVHRSCGKNYAIHHNAPHTCDGMGVSHLPNDQGPTTHFQTAQQEATGQPGVINSSKRDRQTMGVSPKQFGSLRGTHICDAPDLCSSAFHDSKENVSKCPCRYPPSFKHLSCAGNITGSCSCHQNN